MTSIAKRDWLPEFRGKTLHSLRPVRDTGTVPQVKIEFTDGSCYMISVAPNVYFEGMLLNTLRKAQPITDVIAYVDDQTWTVEIETVMYPLFLLIAKCNDGKDFPFRMERVHD